MATVTDNGNGRVGKLEGQTEYMRAWMERMESKIDALTTDMATIKAERKQASQWFSIAIGFVSGIVGVIVGKLMRGS